ncbi:MAG: squalene/phytoene synthase family protein [Candidatus Eremiobacteraeota bacterium]|nr:squalene/phytoene synthase family protein [Candidatus Eremiobacteraeota bacterium]
MSDRNRYSEILKETSRAFYLSLAVLPSGAREPLSLAYLLARAADTVADSPTEHTDSRTPVLRRMQASLTDVQVGSWDQLRLFQPEKEGEFRLLRAYPEVLELLHESEPSIRQPIQSVVGTLIEGMLWDQQLFHDKTSQEGLTIEELEKYTYLVAGCVGPFWSQVCALSDPRLSHLISQNEVAVEFGKALQWVNILRDVPEDQKQGRFYLPALERPELPAAFLRYSERALCAFGIASHYPLLFPSFYVRHRLSVFMPLVLGLRTLELLFEAGGPRHDQRVKVSRQEVFGWLAAGLAAGCSRTVLKGILAALRKRAWQSLKKLESDFV